MIDFNKLQSTYPVSGRPGAARRYSAGKKETGYGAGTNPAGNTDVVQISADAALKGKLSAFSVALAKEIDAVSPQRMAALKEKYAGNACPVSSDALAEAILARADMGEAAHE